MSVQEYEPVPIQGELKGNVYSGFHWNIDPELIHEFSVEANDPQLNDSYEQARYRLFSASESGGYIQVDESTRLTWHDNDVISVVVGRCEDNYETCFTINVGRYGEDHIASQHWQEKGVEYPGAPVSDMQLVAWREIIEEVMHSTDEELFEQATPHGENEDSHLSLVP